MKIRRDRGNTLFVVLFFIVVLSSFAGAAFNYTSGTAAVGQRSTQMTLGYGVADAAMELVYSRWRAIVQAHTSKNLGSTVFIDGGNVYNALGRDITVVLLSDLGMNPGYLGLPASIANPADLAAAGTITIRTVDVFGRVYGTYGPDGRSTDTAYPLIEATNRVGYNVSTNDYYPPPGSPDDYSFLTAIGSANGFTAVNVIYEVRVQLSVPSRNGVVPVGVVRRFTRSVANAAQAAIFFENRLEVFPGSNMTVTGRVHTNDDLYVGTRSTTDLSFLKKVTYAGEDAFNTNASALANHQIVQLGYGYGDSSLNTTYVPTDRFQGNTAGAPELVSPMIVGGINRDYLQPYDSLNNPNYNNNSLREVIERPVRKASATGDPSVQAFSAYWDVPSAGDAAIQQAAVEASRLYNQASIKVSLVYDVAGHLDVGQTVIRAATPEGMADGPLLSTVNATLNTAILDALNTASGGSVAVRTRTLVKDARESYLGTVGNSVAATTLDVGALKTAITASAYDFNGILYIADVTGQNATTLSYNNTATDYETAAGNRLKHAIMLINGASVPGADNTDLSDPKRAFTVATENGVYIKGDYNTGGSGGAVPSNTGPVTANTFATGYTPVTAAVMGDAIAVMSSQFDPTKGYDGFFTTQPSTIDPTKAKAINYVTGVEIDPNLATLNPAAFIAANGTNAVTREAVSTTVNTAIVSGIFENNATQSGGGATNLIRFMENWGQVPKASSGTTVIYDPSIGSYGATGSNVTSTKFTYRGSMMQSFFSKELTSNWSSPSTWQAYNAPRRVVQFDDSFINKPPAGFPGTISYTKGTWERF